jgi:acetyl-CoA carboxylase biotin carboxyl carrier protein
MADAESRPGDVFDEERLSRLIEMMKEHDLEEIDLQEAEQCIRLRRNIGGGLPPTFGAPGFPAAYAAPPPPAYVPAVTSAASESAAPEADSDSIVVITSPMVGTFYAKPNPKAQPFVRVGEHVDAEKTICIIEAMKVFNEIPAEVTGKIVAILVQDEEPVEFGKPLFKVDTKG